MSTPKVQVVVSYFVDNEFNTERYLVPLDEFNVCEEAKTLFEVIRSSKSSNRYVEDLAATNDEEKFGSLAKLLLKWENAYYILSLGRLSHPVTIVEEYFLENDSKCRWTIWETNRETSKRKREDETENDNLPNKRHRSIGQSEPKKESIELTYEEQEDWESFADWYILDSESLFEDSPKTRDQFLQLRTPCLKKFGHQTMLECSDARERMRDVMLMLNGQEPSGLGLECTKDERDAYEQIIKEATSL